MIKCCNDSICNTYSEYELADILLSSAQKLSEYSDKTNIFLNYGFGCSKSKDFLQLSSLRDGLQHQYNQIINSETPCLCPCRFQPLLEKVLGHIGVTCKVDPSTLITIDDSGFEAWAVTHPLCVTLETWETCLCSVCEDIKFDINLVSDSVHDCMIQYQLTPQTPVSLDICKINFDVLRTTKNCDITFNQYVNLINCGITHSSIINIIDCSIPISLISTITNCDIDFDSVSSDPNANCDIPEEDLVAVNCCDDPPPILITCPPDQEVTCTEDIPFGADITGVSASGGCGELTIFVSSEDGTGPCPRIVNRHFMAFDGCGNFSDECVTTYTSFDLDPECNQPCP